MDPWIIAEIGVSAGVGIFCVGLALTYFFDVLTRGVYQLKASVKGENPERPKATIETEE